jgi:imidazole glycerol-phosphate synthase subunit HisH
VVEYHAGNVRSIANALEHLGARVEMVSAEHHLSSCSHVLLPGVGAFRYCADRLRESGLVPALEQWAVHERRPMLGICVGMQLFADWGEELGGSEGLGWIGGSIVRLPATDPACRIPHVGWNNIEFHLPFGDFQVGEQADFYFDHSFALDQPVRAEVMARCQHGRTFPAVIARDALVAAQFHPEKSQTAGLRFLSAFLSLR